MLRKNSFNGGTNTSVITTGNSGGASGDGFTAVGGAPVYTTSQATGDRGPLVARLVPSSDVLVWDSLTLTGRTLYLRAYLYLTATPSLGDYIISAGGASIAVALWIDSSGRLSVRNSGLFTDFAKQSSSVPVNTWCRVEVKFTIGTTSSNGACEIRRYDSADSATSTQTTTASSIDLGTDLPTWVRFWYGVDQTILYDDIGATDADWLGPEIHNVPVAATDTAALVEAAPVVGLAVSDSGVLADAAGADPGHSRADTAVLGDLAALTVLAVEGAQLGEAASPVAQAAAVDAGALDDATVLDDIPGPVTADVGHLGEAPVISGASAAADTAALGESAGVGALWVLDGRWTAGLPYTAWAASTPWAEWAASLPHR